MKVTGSPLHLPSNEFRLRNGNSPPSVVGKVEKTLPSNEFRLRNGNAEAVICFVGRSSPPLGESRSA